MKNHHKFREFLIPFQYKSNGVVFKLLCSNRSAKKVSTCVLLHGSGGVGITEKLVSKKILENNFNVIVVDYFTPNGIMNLKWEGLDKEKNITYQTTSTLITKGLEYIKKIDFINELFDLNNLIISGFSLGGSVALILSSNENIKQSISCYPSVNPITKSLMSINTEKIQVFVGANDNWNPLSRLLTYKKYFPDLKINIIENGFHGFMKYGSDFEIDSLSLANMPFGDKIYSDEEYEQAILTGIWHKQIKEQKLQNYKIKLKYDEEGFKTVLNQILKGLSLDV